MGGGGHGLLSSFFIDFLDVVNFAKPLTIFDNLCSALKKQSLIW